MNQPEVPKVVKPKEPIEPEMQEEEMRRQSKKPKGINSLVSAGRLTQKATTIKSSLLGG
jgi:hypothetical protein